jgi:hypothetical protein
MFRSAALSTIDNCTEEGVGLLRFLLTSRNFLQPAPAMARTHKAVKEYMKDFLLIIGALFS